MTVIDPKLLAQLAAIVGPDRVLTESHPDGPTKGKQMGEENFKTMISEYYRSRGWDGETGIPLPETIASQRIDDDAERFVL